jgi:hypothetical protein
LHLSTPLRNPLCPPSSTTIHHPPLGLKMLTRDGFAPPPSGASLHHSPNKPFTRLTSLPPR